MLTLAMMAGLWITSCTQTQMNGKQGNTVETYSISSSGNYEFTRTWYSDAGCTKFKEKDTETGTLSLGKAVTGDLFNKDAQEADFQSNDGKDLGAASVKGSVLKIARGTKNSSMRNTMLGIFEYKKN